jgi:murein DD-endopeptidase MepM/ murein hydrolase activator NlpD
VPAAAQTGGAAAPEPGAGGVTFEQPTGGRRLVGTEFTVSPGDVTAGGTLRFAYRLDGRPRRVRVRIDLVPMSPEPARVARIRLGRQPTGVRRTVTWDAEVAPGRYRAHLRATGRVRSRTARAAGPSQPLVIVRPAPAPPPPPVPPSTLGRGIFPVQGPHDFGGRDARFGAGRDTHSHQGQDILAAAGTPVVAPFAGSVHWRAYQREGAGHYIVIRAADGRDYVFMHLLDGSLAVEKGQTVAAGQQLAAVGATGRATGPHLHFEIWPDGWFASSDSRPIDPLPELLTWSGA